MASTTTEGVMRRFAVAVVLAVAVTVVACGDDYDDAKATSTAATRAFDITRFTGVYEGTWRREGGGVGGDASIEIAAPDADSGSATLTIDFDGNYLGLGDPPAHTMDVGFDQTGAKGTGKHPLFGNYDVTIDRDGTMRGRFTDVGLGVIPLLTYTGVLTGETIDADYEVTRRNQKVAKATVTLEKVRT